MKISPEDVRQQQFGTKFRGFNIEEVDSYLELIANELEELYRENSRLRDDLQSIRRKNEEMKQNEINFRTMIVSAQEFKEDISTKSRKEAELVIKQAEIKAGEIIAGAEQKAYSLEKRIADLRNEKNQFEIALKSMIENHLNMLNSSPE